MREIRSIEFSLMRFQPVMQLFGGQRNEVPMNATRNVARKLGALVDRLIDSQYSETLPGTSR